MCSVTEAVDVFGDQYSLPIVRELFYGNTHFSDLVDLVGAPRTLLSGRLRRLEDVGVIQRRRYSEHPPRDEYLLTDAGRELLPVLLALRDWGDRHCGLRRPSERLKFAHNCGAALQTEATCAACKRVVRFEDLVVTGKIQPSKRRG